MTSPSGQPTISVVVPTYKRPALLARALESVLAQGFADFEVIVCDDEDPPGESRLIAQRVAAGDARVRVIANGGRRGQAGNLNFAMSRARGAWIKPLYDDDVLEPECLERMLAAALMAPERVSVVRCLARRFDHGLARRDEPRGRRGLVECLGPADAMLAQYLQDVDVGAPTQMLVSRAAVEGGAVMPVDGALVSGVDSAWAFALSEAGCLVLLNEHLVQLHQGGHETVTSGMSDRALDAEFATLREMQHERLGGVAGVPDVKTAQAMLRAIRAIQRGRRLRLGGAVSLAASVRSFGAWALALRWAMRRAFPGRFEIVKRTLLSLEPGPHDARRDPGVRLHAQRAGAHHGVSHADHRRTAG